MPSMCIVKEMTIGLGESVTPNTPFTQSWMLENNGIVAWPQGCYLKLVSEINNDGKMFVPSIAPNDTHILTINLVSPSEFGQFRSQFCLCTPAGVTFGPIIWSVVDVSVAGTLALTQQLTQLHTSEQTQQAQQNVAGNWDEDGMQGTEVTGVTLPQSSNSGGSGQLQVKNPSSHISSISNSILISASSACPSKLPKHHARRRDDGENQSLNIFAAVHY